MRTYILIIIVLLQCAVTGAATVSYYQGGVPVNTARLGNLTIMASLDSPATQPMISINQMGLLDVGDFGPAAGEFNMSEEMPAQKMQLIETDADLVNGILSISSDPESLAGNLMDHDRATSWNSDPGVQTVTVDLNISETSLDPYINTASKVVIVQSDMNMDPTRNIATVDVYFDEGVGYVFHSTHSLDTSLNSVNEVPLDPAVNTTRIRLVMTNGGSIFGTAAKEIEVYNTQANMTLWKYVYQVHKATKFFNTLPGYDAYLDGQGNVHISDGTEITLENYQFTINTTLNQRMFIARDTLTDNLIINIKNVQRQFYSRPNFTLTVYPLSENRVSVRYNRNQSAVPTGNMTVLAIFPDMQNDVVKPQISIDQQGLCDVGYFYVSEYNSSCDTEPQEMEPIMNKGNLVKSHKDLSNSQNISALFDGDTVTDWTYVATKTSIMMELNLSNTDDDYPINLIDTLVLVQGNQYDDVTRNIKYMNISYYDGTGFVPLVNLTLNTSSGYRNEIALPEVNTNQVRIWMKNNGNALAMTAREIELRTSIKNYTYWKYNYDVQLKTGEFAGLDAYVDGNATVYITDSNSWEANLMNNVFYIQSVPLNRKPVLRSPPRIYVEGMGPMSRSPYVTDVVECYAGKYFDADNETLNMTQWKWFVQGALVSGNKTLNLSAFNQRDQLICSQRVHDGHHWSTWYNSTPVEINGSQPIMTHFEMDRVLPYQKGSTAVFRVDVSDPDGDSFRLYVCREQGTNQSWCQDPYCISSLTSSEGTAQCSFNTSLTDVVVGPVNYSYYAYVCDVKGICSSIPLGGNMTVYTPVNVQLSLKKGWNLIAMPAVPIDEHAHEKNITAEDLMNITGTTMVVEYNGTSQKYYTHIASDINNFPILLSESYYVYSPQDKVINLSGKPIMTISKQLHPGWNFVNYPVSVQASTLFTNNPGFRNIVGYRGGRLMNQHRNNTIVFTTMTGYGLMVYNDGTDSYNYTG